MGTKVNANPTKEFFISMLTRDIDIKAAILELIDNSIDGAKRLRPDGNYDGLFIEISYDKDKFSIKDNCGGMSIETATQYAFRFGRSNDRPSDKDSQQHFTGIFGIGMKRSLFRLGEYFEVSSKTTTDYFKLQVDVDEWVKKDDVDWSFQLSEELTGQNYSDEETGTLITVSKLHKGISEQFSLTYFMNMLVSYIEKYRTIAVENGLQITVNGKTIVYSSQEIVETKNVTPYAFSKTIDDVNISVIAGIAPKGEPENAGWYVYCNGRLVIFADKTQLTGWGEDQVRQYHPSLAFFRGFVFFESSNLEKLPWNTTKTGVDSSSSYYIFAKSKMKEALIQMIKSCKVIADDLPEDISNSIFKKANLKPINSSYIARITSTDKSFDIVIPEIEKKEPTASITFSKPQKIVEVVKKRMKVSTNRDVGITAFDYYVRKECDIDE